MSGAAIIGVVVVAALIVALFVWQERRLAETKRAFWARVWAMDSDAERVEYLDNVSRQLSTLHGSPACTFSLECSLMARKIAARRLDKVTP